jgi:hypothetical protein
MIHNEGGSTADYIDWSFNPLKNSLSRRKTIVEENETRENVSLFDISVQSRDLDYPNGRPEWHRHF